MNHLRLISILVLASFCAVANAKKLVNCYYGTWSNWRPGSGKFDATNIDPKLCTHISYTFFGIETSGEFKVLDTWLDLDSGLGMIKKTIAHKQANPDLKVLAVVGGWEEGSVKYSAMAADPSKRKLFISSTLKFIKEHGFDGLDLDWEYPAQRDGSPQDKQNFVTLLKEIKEAFKPLNLELGIAVGASANTASQSYDIPNVSKHVDFINVMTYDLQDVSKLSFNAPLRGQGQNNVEESIKYWLAQGAPASKLILGLAFYGRHFSYSQQTTPGSSNTGIGAAGPFTRLAGYMGYNEICSLAKSSAYTTKFDETHGVPYTYNANQWIGYDNVKSIEMKVQFANSMNLGGVMTWSLETDDFRGECGEKYPLLNAINRQLGGTNSGSQTSPTTRPSNTTTKKPVDATAAPPAENHPSGTGCSSDGYFTHETDCTRFYQCASGTRYDYVCPPGLKFHTITAQCTWPAEANCAR